MSSNEERQFDDPCRDPAHAAAVALAEAISSYRDLGGLMDPKLDPLVIAYRKSKEEDA